MREEGLYVRAFARSRTAVCTGETQAPPNGRNPGAPKQAKLRRPQTGETQALPNRRKTAFPNPAEMRLFLSSSLLSLSPKTPVVFPL